MSNNQSKLDDLIIKLQEVLGDVKDIEDEDLKNSIEDILNINVDENENKNIK